MGTTPTAIFACLAILGACAARPHGDERCAERCTHIAVATIEVRAWEAVLSGMPELSSHRRDLLEHYYRAPQMATSPDAMLLCGMARLRHLIWFVQHRPWHEVLQTPAGTELDFFINEDEEELTMAWRLAIHANFDDARVLRNALHSPLFRADGPNADYAWLCAARLKELEQPNSR